MAAWSPTTPPPAPSPKPCARTHAPRCRRTWWCCPSAPARAPAASTWSRRANGVRWNGRCRSSTSCSTATPIRSTTSPGTWSATAISECRPNWPSAWTRWTTSARPTSPRSRPSPATTWPRLPPATSSSAWPPCCRSGPWPRPTASRPRAAPTSGDDDGDLADARLPLARAGGMHGFAGGIDRHGHRHVLHGELVDRFHAQVLERDDARGLDRLGHQVGGAADGHQVGRAVLADGVDRDRPAFGLADHAQQAGLFEHLRGELVHARGRGRARRADDLIAHRI